MQTILRFFVFGILLTVFSGCSGKSIPTVEQEEVDKYEKSYLSEFEILKGEIARSEVPLKALQPKNKKEECKIYVFINPNNQTTKSDYSLFWDGECKEGYAYGLGSRIENTMLSNLLQIAFYEKGLPVDYCSKLDLSNGYSKDGECLNPEYNSNHFVETHINERNNDLQIVNEIGIEMSKKSPISMTIRNWQFLDAIEYYKSYPNYTYIISDLTKDEFDNRNYEFNIKNLLTEKVNGFSFVNYKNGYRSSYEIIDGNFTRSVELPQSYFNKANSILSEIKNEVNIALEAQRRALIIKEKYKNKICKDTVKVDFMDNNEYKAICKEDEKNAQLKIKIDAKLAQIAQQKQAKRQQRNEERLIQAREAEAMAAKRQASAAQASAAAQQQANTNQMMQNNLNNLNNVNNNLQMQNLNNNLNNINNTLNNSNSGSYYNGSGYYNGNGYYDK